MAGEETCYNALRNLADLDALKDKDLQNIVDAVENIRTLAEKDKFSFQEKMMRELEKIKTETANQRIEKIKASLVHKNNVQLASQPIFKDRPYEAIVARLGQVQTPAKSAVDSIANRQMVMRETNGSKYFQGLLAAGEDAIEVMKTGEIDKDIYIEIERLQDPNSKLPDTNNKLAKEIAKVQVNVNKTLKMDLERGLGHQIGDVGTYVTKQVHDRNAVRGDDSKEAMNAWIDDILPMLDTERTFGARTAVDEAAMRARLEESWRHITTGERASEMMKRSLHFKDAEQAYNYNLMYGNKSLYEATLARISDTARYAAQMDVLGPNPRQGLERLINTLDKQYRSSNPKVWKKFRNDKRAIENIMLELEGYTSMPGDSLMASAGRFARAYNNLTYISNTGARALGGNIPVLALEVRSSQGLNAFETVKVGLDAMLTRFALSIGPDGIKNKLARETFLKTGMAMQDFHFGIASQFTEDVTPGRASRAAIRFFEMMSRAGVMEKTSKSVAREIRSKGVVDSIQKPFFKLTGLSQINDIDRATTARLMMGGVFEKIGNDFDALPAQFKANIERAGIDAPRWKILQLAGDRLETNGMEIVSPQKILEMNPQVVEQIMKEHKIGGSADNFLRDTYIKYGTYLWSASNISTTTPDVRTAAFTKQGFTEDQWQGQFLRLVFQFKSFTIFQRDLMTRFFTANPEDGARELSDIIRGRGSVGTLMAYASSATLFYYMSDQLIRLGLGKDFQEPTPDVIGNAFLKSGAIGFLGDFIDAESGYGKDRTIYAYAAGPTFGRGVNAFRLGLQAARGENIEKEAGSFINNLVPLQNYFVTRRAMEPLILDPLREMVDPDYAYRKEIQRMKREMGQ